MTWHHLPYLLHWTLAGTWREFQSNILWTFHSTDQQICCQYGHFQKGTAEYLHMKNKYSKWFVIQACRAEVHAMLFWVFPKSPQLYTAPMLCNNPQRKQTNQICKWYEWVKHSLTESPQFMEAFWYKIPGLFPGQNMFLKDPGCIRYSFFMRRGASFSGIELEILLRCFSL